MRGAQAAKIPALHRTGKTLTDGLAGDIDLLTDHKVIRRQLGTRVNHVVARHAELNEFAFRSNLGLGKVTAHRLGCALGLGSSDTELQRRITVTVFRPLRNDLTAVHVQHGDRQVGAVFGEDPGHPELLGYETSAHGSTLRV